MTADEEARLLEFWTTAKLKARTRTAHILAKEDRKACRDRITRRLFRKAVKKRLAERRAAASDPESGPEEEPTRFHRASNAKAIEGVSKGRLVSHKVKQFCGLINLSLF